MRLIYTFFIYFYYAVIRIAALFNKKAMSWVVGRRDIMKQIQTALADSKNNAPMVWFHCASLGEFEQGRPVIEQLRKEHPELKIILTFFSPSGYEIRKNYSGADHVFYLPLDTPNNAKYFVALVKPIAVFFVKYEFWFNYLNELKKYSIPTYLISGIFRQDHYFFKGYAFWFRAQLKAFSHFYLQDKQSQQLLQLIGYTNSTLAGDTRFDRVYAVSQTVKSIPLLDEFKQQSEIFIAGSTWEQDETILASFDFFTARVKLIIAPHEISVDAVRTLSSKFTNSICYSSATADTIKTANVLIIDSIGMLSALYQYGSIAYIGGGFGKGIHNVLVFTFIGYEKFTEAKELLQRKAAFAISDATMFNETMLLLMQSPAREKGSVAAIKYVEEHTGATQKILQSVRFNS